MRPSTAVVAIACAVVASLAANAIAVLTRLADSDVAIAPLVVGDLTQLFASTSFWRPFPSLPPLAVALAWGPLLVVAAAALVVARATPRAAAATRAAQVLAVGALPFAVGLIALRGNTDPAAAGPWLAWMLAGPLYAALGGLAAVLRAALPRRDAAAAVVARPV